MESLLAMPITPLEIMAWQDLALCDCRLPWQAALILVAGLSCLFDVPVVGNLVLLASLTTLFIATNLSFRLHLLDGSRRISCKPCRCR